MAMLNKRSYERMLKEQHDRTKVRKKIAARTKKAATKKTAKRKPRTSVAFSKVEAAKKLDATMRQKLALLKKMPAWRWQERQALVSFCQGMVVYAKEIRVIDAEEEAKFLTMLAETVGAI